MKKFLNKFISICILIFESSVLLSASEKINEGGFIKDFFQVPNSILKENGNK